MFTKGSKELMKVRMSRTRSNFLIGSGVVFIVIAMLALMFYFSNRRIISWYDIEGLFIVMIILFLESGISACMNGVAIQNVCLIVYDEGIYGVCAKINPLCGLFTKTIPYDVPFADITDMRYENGSRLLIQTRYRDYAFVISRTEAYQVMELLENRIGK